MFLNPWAGATERSMQASGNRKKHVGVGQQKEACRWAEAFSQFMDEVESQTEQGSKRSSTSRV
jgi:hypothetical protein